ncbi:MAG: Bug family tripartite tricarboxylate transporter substrate binding protein [Burkholderiales bacterium]
MTINPARLARNVRTIVLCIAAGAGLPGAVAHAQTWPAKPMRIVVPYPAGGGIDIMSRLIAQRLAQSSKQPVVVENKPGAGTLVAAETVARAAPDGTTLMITTDATITINPYLYTKLPYDPARDFIAVTQLVLLNQLLLGNAGLAPANLRELIAHAKSNPGKLNYASYGVGSQPHLAMEILKSQAGIDIVHVPYKGIPQAVPAAIAGEVQLTFSGAASSMAHLRSGKLKAYAIGGAKRLSLVPEVPTFAEQGFPDVPANAWFGLFVPTGTPREIVLSLHGEVTRLMRDPEFLQKEVIAKGYELVAGTPEEFAAFLVQDNRRNANAVRISGARAD